MIQEKDIPQIVKVISLLKENSDGKKFTSYFSYEKKDNIYTVDFFNYEQVLERISIREDSVDGVLASLQSRIEQATTDLGIEKNSGYIDRDKKALEEIFDKVRRLNSCDNVKTLSFSFETDEEEFLFRIAWDYCKDGCKRYFCINGNTPQNTLEELKSSYEALPIGKKERAKLKALCQEKGQEEVKFMASFYKKYHKEELYDFFMKSLDFPFNRHRLNPAYQRKSTVKEWERIGKWEDRLMRNPRLRFYHVTLTVPNIECTELSRAWRAMNKAVKRLLALAQFRGCHHIRKFEADYVEGAKENTHPHIHIFIASEKKLDDLSREELACLWQKKLAKERYCVDISHEAQHIKRVENIVNTMFYVTKNNLFSKEKGHEFLCFEAIKTRFCSLGGAYADWLEVYNKEMKGCRDISLSESFRKEKCSFGTIYKAKKLIGENFLDELGD